MSILIKSCLIDNKIADVVIKGDKIESIIPSEKAKKLDEKSFDNVISANGKLTLLPAFVDMHTHLREPGYEGKETILTGTRAAVAGGYASVCCMPNTNPTVDSPYIIKYIIDRAKEANLAKVYPIGAITVGLNGGLMAEMGKMKEAGAVAMSDDGQPVTSAQMMRLALEYAKDFDLLMISHCEEKSLIDEGVVNEGKVSAKIGLKGIPSAAEDIMIAREIILADMLNTKVHIAHVSTRTGTQLIREAKARGVKVSCETCPHYIVGTDELVVGFNTMAKVNPPLRTEKDRQAIIEGLKDGTIDALATDHAPHTKQDKECEFNNAANGISGLETAFSLNYTTLVKSGKITLSKLSELMTSKPSKLMNIPCGEVKENALADLTLVDLEKEYTIDSSKFFSKGKNTPFNGMKVVGKVEATIVGGELKFSADSVAIK